MVNLSEHHEYLLLGKITNTLSEDEAQETAALLRENSLVQEAYDELVQELPASQVTSSFDHLNKPGYWKDLTAQLGRQRSSAYRTIFLKRIAAAAVITAIIAGSWSFWKFEQSKQTSRQQIAAVHKPAGVQLRLANGKVIDLSAEKGAISEKEATLTNSNKTLTYTVSGKEGEGMNSVTVPIGMDYRINLSDGTEVWLNAATKVDFPFAFKNNTREITINGEAYLKVAPDKNKPFIVHLPGSTVRVMGTEFNVNTYDPGTVKVALVEGSVKMKSPSGEVRLVPGKEGVCGENGEIQQRSFDAKFVLGWQKGLFYFDEASLSDISKVVPRWFGIQVVIDNPALVNKKFVGVLDRNQPISVFQDDLKVISGIDSYIDANHVLHFK